MAGSIYFLITALAADDNSFIRTFSPETVVIPIISCIFGFPLLALLVICCLRRRAKMAREQARRRNYEVEHGTCPIIRFSPIHYLVIPPATATKNSPHETQDEFSGSLAASPTKKRRLEFSINGQMRRPTTEKGGDFTDKILAGQNLPTPL
ncbi:hypothetical protein NQ317_005252 [Molorchus minor]|uniref:Uncharacterized protein n=1 Tax=Molorchus minor TaxID=1323400 RepID=A0ABQ9JYT5_9CUCU|nr:hypothetical protein NQ317_005252 [Molorchus minor]